MRHRSKTKKFNRDTKSRKALFKNLVRSLIEQGFVVTTEAKAKETKRLTDKLIGRAKNDTLATRRILHKFFGTRDVVNTLVDKIAPQFKDRSSGFTRIVKLGVRRGDSSKMAQLSLVEKPETMGTLKNVAAKAKRETKTTVKKSVKKTPTKKVAVDSKKKTATKKAVKKETK